MDERLYKVYLVIVELTAVEKKYFARMGKPGKTPKFISIVFHDYIHELIEKGMLPDMWGDWILTGLGWYSWNLAGDIEKLMKMGLIEETCSDDGKVCGLIKLTEKRIEKSISPSLLMQN